MLRVTNLVKTFGASKREERKRVHAVDDVSLEVRDGELFTLLGPSGCGKTTTLRCVAGLESPDSGEIEVDGKIFFSSSRRIRVPANERGLGMVFQSYAIWPHLNVFKNVAFPLEVLPRRKRPSRKELVERVERTLAVVKLDHLACSTSRSRTSTRSCATRCASSSSVSSASSGSPASTSRTTRSRRSRCRTASP
jgi:iron(III) transport system ATP-binding protein